MSTVHFGPVGHRHQRFFINDEEGQIAEMTFVLEDGIMSVDHTLVEKRGEGKGLAKELLNAMVAYAREHHYKVRPLCPYVEAQFRKNAEQYKDLVAD